MNLQKCLVLGILLALTVSRPTSAQGTHQPVATLRGDFSNASWSADSSMFIFQESFNEAGVQTEDNTWYEYHTNTRQITRTNRWKLQPALSAAQIKTLELISFPSGQTSFALASPNNRYIVYASQYRGYKNLEYGLAIADLQNNTHVMLGAIIFCCPGDFSHGYDVRWSADSTAFTVETNRLVGGPSHTYYISNFASSLSSLSVRSLDNGIPVGSLTSYADRVFALSPDGKLVLLEDRTVNGAGILIWDVNNATQTREVEIGGIFIAGATFVPGTKDKLRYIGDKGLVEYDLIKGQGTVLDASINTSWVGGVWFSPDGSSVALARHTFTDTLTRIYVVEIAKPSTTSPTSTALVVPTASPSR